MRVEIDFVANGDNLAKFLEALNKQLKNLGFDTSDFDVDELTKDFKGAATAAAGLGDELGETAESIQRIEKEGEKTASTLSKMFAFDTLDKANASLSKFNDSVKGNTQSLKLLGVRSGVTGAELKGLADSAKSVYGSSIAFDSFSEATQAIATANAQLKEFYSPDELERFTVLASGIAKAWDQDVNDVIRKSAPLIKNFGVTADEAAGLITSISQSGGADDILDTFHEYSQVLKTAFSPGVEGAREFSAVLQNGLDAGVRDTDKLGDAFKEAQLRINEGIAGADLTSIQAPVANAVREIVELGQQGKKSVLEVMQDTSKLLEEAVASGDINGNLASQIQIAVAGTPAEDIGIDLFSRIMSAPIDTGALGASAAQASADLAAAIDVPDIGTKIGRDLEFTFAGLGSAIGPVLEPLSHVSSTLGVLGPVVAQNAAAAGQFGLMILSKVVPGLVLQTGATTASAVATTAQATAQTGATASMYAFNTAMLANPIFLGAAALIAATAAAFLLFSDSTKSADDAIADLNESTERLNDITGKGEAVKAQSKELRTLADEYDSLSDKQDPKSQERFAEVAEELNNRLPGTSDRVAKLGENGQLLGYKYSIATASVREFANENDRLANEAIVDAQESQADQVAAAVDTWDDLKVKVAEAKEERDLYREAAKDGGESDRLGGDWETVGTNLKDSTKNLGDYRAEQDKVTAKLQEYVKQQAAQGKTMQETADAIDGLDVGQVAELGANFFEAERAAAATGGEMRVVGKEIASAAGEAKRMGVEFANALAASADLSAGAALSLAQALFNLEAAKKAGNAEEVARLKEQVAMWTNRGKDAVVAQANMQSYLDAANKTIGRNQRERSDQKPDPPPREKKEFDAAEYVDDVLKGLTEAAELRGLEGIDQQLKELAQNKLSDLEALTDKAKELRDKVIESEKKDSTIIFRNRDRIADLEEGGAAYIKTLTKYQEEEKQIKRDYFRAELKERADKYRESVEKGIEDIESRAGRINAVDKESIDKKTALLSSANALRFELEERGIIENNNTYLDLLADRATSEKELSEATTADATALAKSAIAGFTEDIKAQEELILATGREMVDLRNLEILLTEDITEVERKETEEKVAIIKAGHVKLTDDARESAAEYKFTIIQNAEDEKRIAREVAEYLRSQRVIEIERQNKDKEEELQRHLSELQAIVDGVVTITEARGERFIGEAEAEALERLAERRAKDIISEENYEQQKIDIARAAESEREGLRGRARGIEIEAERQKTLSILKAEVTAKEALKIEAEESGDILKVNKLEGELRELGKSIEREGKIITGIAAELQTGITEIFTGLIGGDEEDIKKPFKRAFGVLVGALQHLASAKITEVILGSISGALGLPGLAAAFGLKPAITGIINGLLNPLFERLNSFAGGSGPLTTPQLAWVGDAEVPERVIRDDDLEKIITASGRHSAETLIPLLVDIRNAINNLDLTITEGEIASSANVINAKRARGLIG